MVAINLVCFGKQAKVKQNSKRSIKPNLRLVANPHQIRRATDRATRGNLAHPEEVENINVEHGANCVLAFLLQELVA